MRGTKMKVINWKNALYIIVSITAIVLIVKFFANDLVLEFEVFIAAISLSVTINSVLSILFCKTLWKLKIFQKWLVLIPNLNGKWEGQIDSDAIHPFTYEDCKGIKTQLIIKQTLFSISCVMKTNEMTSRSVSANFIIDAENQRQQLVYTYQSIPKQTVQYWSPIHFGTALYDLDDPYQVNTLDGNYWTGRRTTGCIKLTKCNH